MGRGKPSCAALSSPCWRSAAWMENLRRAGWRASRLLMQANTSPAPPPTPTCRRGLTWGRPAAPAAPPAAPRGCQAAAARRTCRRRPAQTWQAPSIGRCRSLCRCDPRRGCLARCQGAAAALAEPHLMCGGQRWQRAAGGERWPAAPWPGDYSAMWPLCSAAWRPPSSMTCAYEARARLGCAFAGFGACESLTEPLGCVSRR